MGDTINLPKNLILAKLQHYFSLKNEGVIKPIPHPVDDPNFSDRDDYDASTYREAAVLIPLITATENEQEKILLTLRTEHLNSHAGQVSLPGGSSEPGDEDLIETALRESEEEIGLNPADVKVIGTLGTIVLPSGFCVTPVIGSVKPDYPFRPCPREVAEIFQVPASLLLRPESWQSCYVTYKDRRRKVLELHYGNYRIWGATAAILYHLATELEAI